MLEVNERSVVEQTLPAHLMFIMAEDLRRQGWELRKDILEFLNRSMAASFAGVPKHCASTIAAKIDGLAMRLLRDVNPDDTKEGLLVAARFILKLVSEGLYKDVQNQAVLVALAVTDEADEKGGEWVTCNKDRVEMLSGRMLFEAQKEGFYLHLPLAESVRN